MEHARKWLGVAADLIQVGLFVAAVGGAVAAAIGHFILNLPVGWLIAVVVATAALVGGIAGLFRPTGQTAAPVETSVRDQSRTPRYGVINRRGAYANLSDATFSADLDLALDNSGEVDAQRARFGHNPTDGPPQQRKN